MVSKLLDLPTVTIRAWESRYGVIEPLRDENGHRIYSDEDVEDLRWLIEQTKEHGLTIKHAAKRLEDMRKQKVRNSKHVSQALSSPFEAAQDVQLRDKLYYALIDIKAIEANALIDAGFSMFEFNYMLHEIIVPVLIRIGDEWEAGKLSVAQEHFSTELIKQRLFQMMRIFQHNPLFPKMIAACPTNERHEVGLLLFTIFLRRKGVEVVYLGADTPVEGLIDIQKMLGIDYVLLSSTDRKKLKEHVSYMETTYQEHPKTTFIIGGHGFSELKDMQLSSSLSIVSLGSNIDQWDQWFSAAFRLSLV